MPRVPLIDTILVRWPLPIAIAIWWAYLATTLSVLATLHLDGLAEQVAYGAIGGIGGLMIFPLARLLYGIGLRAACDAE